MAGWSGLSNGAKALAGGGAAAVLAVVAYLLFGTPLDTGNSQVDPQASDTITQPASQTSPTHETTQGASDTAEADTAEAPAQSGEVTPAAPAGDGAQATATQVETPDPTPEPEAPATDEAATENAEATEAAQTPEAATPQPPKFDIVRVDADGNGLIAGRAEPGAQIELTLDGEVFAQTVADATGAFVVLGQVPQAAEAAIMAIRMSTKGGQVVASDQTVIVAQADPSRLADLNETASAPAALSTETDEAASIAATDETELAATRADPATLDADAGEAGVSVVANAASDATTTPQTGDSAQVANLQDEDAAPALSQTEENTTQLADNADLQTPTGDAAPAPDQPANAQTTELADTTDAPAEPTGDGASEMSTDTAEVAEATGEEAAQPTAPSIILSDADGVSVLQAGGAAPQVLSAIALDSISYDTAGDVTLAGRGTDTDGFVRVYLNNAPVKTLKIEEDGRWRAPLPDVDTGVYTLRIDEVTADGEVVSRVETPFKREEEEVLASLNDTNGGTNGAQVSVVTVQPGNTLWGISRENYGEGLMYVHVFEANKDRIRNPDLIYPGQVFTVPELAAQE